MKLPPFQDYETAFRYIAVQAQKERLIMVIDEYPYLAAGEPAISSILQRCIDLYFKPGKGFLILCGSSMSFMEHQVLDEKNLFMDGNCTIQSQTFQFPGMLPLFCK
jgi:AAA+ ATPase superfamily predicted ATPase